MKFPEVLQKLKLYLRVRKSKASDLAFFVGFSSLLFLLFAGFWFASDAFDLKEKVQGRVLSAVMHLKEGQKEVVSANLSGAEREFGNALEGFVEAEKELSQSGQLLRILSEIHPGAKSAKEIIDAAEKISRAGVRATSLITAYQNFRFNLVGPLSSSNQGGPESEQTTAEFLRGSQSKLREVLDEIITAQDILSRVDLQSLPVGEGEKLNEVKEKVTRLRSLLETMGDMLYVMRGFFGESKSVLVLFQNNRELRATGGFIGTYGHVRLKEGGIKSVKVSSVYDLDGQLRSKIVPPEPVFAVNDRWFLRDSNWFASFPESARKASLFFEREGGETPDVVIALTPELVVRLLRITGPISLAAYSVTINADNFVDQTQFLTSVAYDKTINNPKGMIADFIPIFLDKLMQAEGEKKLLVLDTLYDLLAQKHILFYARDNQLQAIFEKYHWGGNILGSSADYLMVNVSNLGGTKTDSDIKQEINLVSEVDETGGIFNTLTISRMNPLSNDKIFRNLAYLRVFVPKGSVLVSADGFSPWPFEPSKLKKEGVKDRDVTQLELDSTTHNASKTVVTTEAGKTVFGNWLIVEGGETKKVQIRYRLPFSIHQIAPYSLLVQSQAGSSNSLLNYKFSLKSPWQIVKTSSGKINSEGSILEVSNSLVNRDVWYGIVVSRQ